MTFFEQSFIHTPCENGTIAPEDDADIAIRADDHTCPHCTYLNYCQLTPNHTGPHMCSQGHTF